jgi:hypothetical protein
MVFSIEDSIFSLFIILFQLRKEKQQYNNLIYVTISHYVDGIHSMVYLVITIYQIWLGCVINSAKIYAFGHYLQRSRINHTQINI